MLWLVFFGLKGKGLGKRRRGRGVKRIGKPNGGEGNREISVRGWERKEGEGEKEKRGEEKG